MKADVDQVYYKKGRRYIPFGPQEWEGFPADGIWLVEVKPGLRSEQLLLRIGDVPDLYPFAQMAVSRNELAIAISKRMDKPHSAQDLADVVLKWMAGKEKGNEKEEG